MTSTNDLSPMTKQADTEAIELRLRQIRGTQFTPIENALVTEAADTIADLRNKVAAAAQALQDLPDYIEVFRLMVGAGSTKRRVQAQAVADRLEEFRAIGQALATHRDDASHD